MNNKKLKDCAGFTLIELTIALAMTAIVMVLTGSGLLAIMNADRRNRSEINARLELEQALAFMSDEIKMSSQIDVNPNLKILVDNFQFKPSKLLDKIEPILVLYPSPDRGLTQPIIYYLATPPKTSVWQGPQTIYRWGPTLMQDGSYSDGDGHSLEELSPQKLANVEVEYFNEPLIDGISDRSPLQITDISTNSILNCDSQTSSSVPPANDRKGFYLCVTRSGKSAHIWMHKHPEGMGKTQSVSALVVARSN
jgi:prepilin-type N-terminal cleavage/methylation domain-containing protein